MDFTRETNYPLVTADSDESFANAMQLVEGVGLPATMHAAIELGIFKIMAKDSDDAKLSASEIAGQMMSTTRCRNPNAPMMLDRVLRLLASHNIVTCSLVGSERVYGLTPIAKHFVCDQHGESLAPLLALTQEKVIRDSWYQLVDAIVKGGDPFAQLHGKNVFEYLESDPRLNKMFNAAMISQSTIVIRNMLEVYKGFDDIKQLVDVGGGLGVTIEAITSKYPHINGINFDLPHVIQHAPHYPGVEHVSGNMFENVPEGDAIFMKWILHDWSDQHCLRLLKNCYKSIPDNGKVIVLETIAPATAETTAAAKAVLLSDISMMTLFPGARERTQDEFMALATAAGFSGMKLVCKVRNFWAMEFYK